MLLLLTKTAMMVIMSDYLDPRLSEMPRQSSVSKNGGTSRLGAQFCKRYQHLGPDCGIRNTQRKTARILVDTDSSIPRKPMTPSRLIQPLIDSHLRKWTPILGMIFRSEGSS